MSSISVSVNGQCQVPPGFRFQPTEEELLLYYLRKRVSCEKIDLDVIRDIDLTKLEPWDIQAEKCKIGSLPQNDWYLFSHKDKKYPSGTRTNRATIAGFWKATGRDKVIYSNGRPIGLRKTLVFYNGRAPHGERSDWLMYEYNHIVSNAMGGAATEEEGWVVCHIFIKKKKNLKTLNSPSNSSFNYMGINTGHMLDSYYDEGSLEQMFQQVERNCKEEDKAEVVKYNTKPLIYTSNQVIGAPDPKSLHQIVSGLTSWAAFDRLIASQLNGHTA
ncbi:unnamed protein product [Prunus armeniaca]|uniref:NAC domain-containing protein n=1 Tax=Prunus armeniaca TaxID=36596 RepID=A0A6J5VL86_PRUAR|nr:unnamed protein product [Prunus armeniaca]